MTLITEKGKEPRRPNGTPSPHGTGDADRNEEAAVHPVDAHPGWARLFGYGLQHVMAMYAGAVAVPIIVGGAMIAAGEMEPEHLPHLIVADLFVAGIASILQSLGILRLGSRLPLMQGVTFASVAPMIVIGSQHGITAIYGAVIASGVMMMLIAPFFARLVRFFPPLVTGTVITIIGLSLMKVCAGWVSGGAGNPDNPGFGEPMNFLLAGATLALILAIAVLAPKSMRPLAVLAGIIGGTALAAALGQVDFGSVGEASWVAVPQPFLFGLPTFEIGSVLTMFVVGLVVMTETTGDIITVGKIVGKPADRRMIADGLRADGLSTVLGGIFNTFPYTAFAQNVGLVSMSKVASRWVATMAGAILIVFGLLPKMGEVVAAIPSPVLGGAGLVLFGMVAATGIRTLSTVELTDSKALVIAVSVSLGMLPTVLPSIYSSMPQVLQPLLGSGICAGAAAAIILNVVLVGMPPKETPECEVAEASAGTDGSTVAAAAPAAAAPAPAPAPAEAPRT
ncbi:nucleobase:cation symporter-2 family protein [Corynebacterium sp. NPDC060344]|uniref:nucleobase:cation symporter-2 family protein n=1 Tax=Corynebacterium sp. NPDC060344 TaxID=3347101 RepID=UPI0036570DF1